MVSLGKASKQSLKIFSPLYEKYKDTVGIYLGVSDNQEYFLRNDKTLYFYDFTIPELKIIIEFNGSGFHPNTSILTENEIQEWRALYSNKSAEAVIAHDNAKIAHAKSMGYDVLVIWDTDDKDAAIKLIEELIENKL